MSLSMYQSSVPVFIRMLNNLAEFLKKGEVYAKDRKFEPEVLINSRLAPDMFPLSRQVQIASDVSRRCVARLAGVEPPGYEDNEMTFAELYARINNTIDYLKTFKPEQVDGTENKPLTVEVRGKSMDFTGMTLLLFFSLPNMYFHVTTAYNILRHNGVEIGKQDFLGKPSG
jgi:uncharacterized protein